MKIVIAGPPHSGKSVFLGGLCANLPRDMYYLFRACPDGEGSWTYRGNGSEKFRRKGQFTKEQVDWYCQTLHKNHMAPVVLVDIGGRPSEENRRILTEGGVQYGIILAGDLKAVPEWETFLQGCGVRVLAVVHSDYTAQQDNTAVTPLVVHHLERGEDVSSRPTIKRIAELLLEMAPQNKKEEPPMDIIRVADLANQIGKTPVERTLNGKVVSQLCWEGADLQEIARLLHNQEKPPVVRIDGAAPAWLVAALVHECHPSLVEVNSPDGYVTIGCRKPGVAAGNNLSWDVKSQDNGWTLVTVQQADPSQPLVPADMAGWCPPALPMGAKVILSGRMPNWGMASIAMAYHGTAKAVALFQPGIGATVAWTHSAEVPLGAVIQV